jgi:hypothetical protein
MKIRIILQEPQHTGFFQVVPTVPVNFDEQTEPVIQVNVTKESSVVVSFA